MFTLWVYIVMFSDELWRSERDAGMDVGVLAADVRVVLGGVAAAEHYVNGELCAGQELFAEHFDLGGLRSFLPGCSQGFVAAAHKRERGSFGVGDQAVRVRGDASFGRQVAEGLAFVRHGAN